MLTIENLVLVIRICHSFVMYTTIFHLPTAWDRAESTDTDNGLAGGRYWRSSAHVCALADGERHYGHVIRTEQWDAYDATRPNEASAGFKYLGAFVDLTAAMQAVESSVARKRESRATHAGAGVAWGETF
jgi:hypothetical protein